MFNSKDVKEFVNECINKLNIYENKEISFAYTVEGYARRYFGNEKKLIKNKKAIYVYYDEFYIVASPELILLALTKTKRTINVVELKSNIDLDKVFKTFKGYVEQIKKGQIR